jgi:hypothetical protein
MHECTQKYKYLNALTSHLQVKHNKSKVDVEATTLALCTKKVYKIIFGVYRDVAVALLDLETTDLIERDQLLPQIAEIAVRIIKSNTMFNSFMNPGILSVLQLYIESLMRCL